MPVATLPAVPKGWVEFNGMLVPGPDYEPVIRSLPGRRIVMPDRLARPARVRRPQGSVLQPGELFSASDPEYLGEMDVKVELFSEPFDPKPRSKVKGWAFAELTGFGIVNPRPSAAELFLRWRNATLDPGARLHRYVNAKLDPILL